MRAQSDPDAPGGKAHFAGATLATALTLVKRYGERTVVDGVDLDIARGECFALLGPNGAGKTTTLRLLLGLTPPTSGAIEVMGHAIPAAGRQMRGRAGIVPQFDNLDPDFSVQENLITYGGFFRIDTATLRRRLPWLLDFAELGERARAPIQALSGGMRRRLTLARALVNDPELLVLDEPTTGLDPQARQHIWERLHRLQREGRTLLLTTHYMEEAERLCDRAAIIDAGRIVACDSPAALIRRHIEAHVVELRGRLARAWRAEPRDEATLRVEHVGETVLLYGHDRDPLMHQVERQIGAGYLYRPASLEDVFLKLTGRDLRD